MKAIIGAAGAQVALPHAPTTSTVGIVACIGTMFAVTGATVAPIVVGALGRR